MERFIVERHWCIPHEASGTDTYPVEYKSEGMLERDLKAAIKLANEQDKDEFVFHGMSFNSTDKIGDQIFIHTLENWFEQNKKL